MFGVSACELPEDSLIAQFGGPGDYRDCFCREVAGTVTLPEYIERFYCSMAFRPERLVLGLLGRGASNEDARELARGEINRFGVWEMVEGRSATRKAVPSSISGVEYGSQSQPIEQQERPPVGALSSQTKLTDSLAASYSTKIQSTQG
jgi:hypothetical protein